MPRCASSATSWRWWSRTNHQQSSGRAALIRAALMRLRMACKGRRSAQQQQSRRKPNTIRARSMVWLHSQQDQAPSFEQCDNCKREKPQRIYHHAGPVHRYCVCIYCEHHLQCAGCDTICGREMFSKTQANKWDGPRRCRKCIDTAAAQAAAQKTAAVQAAVQDTAATRAQAASCTGHSYSKGCSTGHSFRFRCSTGRNCRFRCST